MAETLELLGLVALIEDAVKDEAKVLEDVLAGLSVGLAALEEIDQFVCKVLVGQVIV